MRGTSMDASTIQTPDGKVAACGRAIRCTRHGIRKAARDRVRRCSSSRCARIRSQSNLVKFRVRQNRLLPVLLLVAGCTAQSAALPALTANDAAAIDAMFQSAVDKGEIPGVVAAVVNRDRVLYLRAFGKQDVGRGIPMSTD